MDIQKYGWKINKKRVGTSAVLNEIGSHAYHIACYVSGLKGRNVFADIKQVSKTVKMDNNAQVMINFNNNAKGLLWTSVMARGGVYGLRFRIFGTKGSIEWVQNDPGYLKFNPLKGAVKFLERGFDRVVNVWGADHQGHVTRLSSTDICVLTLH